MGTKQSAGKSNSIKVKSYLITLCYHRAMTPQRLHVEPLPVERHEGGDIVQSGNERITNILIGSILGDGYLTLFHGQSRRSSLEVKGDDKNLMYLQWLRNELISLECSELKPKKNYHQHLFRTRKSEELGRLRELFYPEGYKIIPKNIHSLLTHPLTLAVWYQDDGSLDARSKYHFNATFATHCFSFIDCQLLVDALHNNFGLDVRVNKCTMRGKLRYKLYVTAASMDRFIWLIKPYIVPCFRYKIGESTLASSRGNT